MDKYLFQQPYWPDFTWDANALLIPVGTVRRLQGELASQTADAGMAVLTRVMTKEAVASAGLEGAVLDEDETRISVTAQLGLPTDNMQMPDEEVNGQVEILVDASRHFYLAMTHARLHGWHAALFPMGYSGMRRIPVAVYRSVTEPSQVMLGATGASPLLLETPDADRLEDEMTRFLTWLNRSAHQVDGLVCAAVAHLWFMALHPYADGNGRIARALTDYVLARDEGSPRKLYSLSRQFYQESDDYFQALAKALKGPMDITSWIKWFLAALAQAILEALNQTTQLMATNAFWADLRRIPMSPRQQSVIAHLMAAGPNGIKGGLTNRRYVSLTQTSPVTAKRDLNDLVNKGVLVKHGKTGRGVSYVLRFFMTE